MGGAVEASARRSLASAPEAAVPSSCARALSRARDAVTRAGAGWHHAAAVCSTGAVAHPGGPRLSPLRFMFAKRRWRHWRSAGLLHHAHFLRERRAAHRAPVLGAAGRRSVPPPSSLRSRFCVHAVRHRHGRARPEDPAGGSHRGSVPNRAVRPSVCPVPAAFPGGWHLLHRLYPHHGGPAPAGRAALLGGAGGTGYAVQGAL